MNNDIFEVIKKRRSIRKYTDKKLDKETINKIIQAGKYAPSADDKQPWRFIVINDKKRINKLSNIVQFEIKKILKKRFLLKLFYKDLRNKENLILLYRICMAPEGFIFHYAPTVIFIITKKERFNDESCACCAQNMMLASYSMGLGSCWIGFAYFLNLNKKTKKEIGVPDGYHISSALIFGYPDEKIEKPPIRKPMANIVKWFD
jgi:nitroreductase